MANQLVTIASFENPAEAHAVRNLLESAGVQAFVADDTVAATLWHVGTAIGGAKVQVAEDDAERALTILDSEAPSETPGAGGAWWCGRCDEPVDAGFDVCWSCGGERAEVEDTSRPPPGDEEIETPGATDEPDEDRNETVAATPPQIDEANPYAPPGYSETPSKANAAPATDEENEAMVARAWRASVIGIVLCPPVLQFYSMLLLIRASMSGAHFSPRATRRFYLALTLNIFVVAVEGVLFAYFLR